MKEERTNLAKMVFRTCSETDGTVYFVLVKNVPTKGHRGKVLFFEKTF